jgi:hypothetical protein
MKLTNQQITALALKIQRDVEAKVKEHNDILTSQENFELWEKKNPKYKQLYKKAIDACKELLKEDEILNIRYYFTNVANYTDEEVINNLETAWENSLNLKTKPFLDDIKEELIIATIDCTGIDEVIERITNKYLNQ